MNWADIHITCGVLCIYIYKASFQIYSFALYGGIYGCGTPAEAFTIWWKILVGAVYRDCHSTAHKMQVTANMKVDDTELNKTYRCL